MVVVVVVVFVFLRIIFSIFTLRALAIAPLTWSGRVDNDGFVPFMWPPCVHLGRSESLSFHSELRALP